MGAIKNAIHEYMETNDYCIVLNSALDAIESQHPKLVEDIRVKMWEHFGEEYMSKGIEQAEIQHDMQKMRKGSQGESSQD